MTIIERAVALRPIIEQAAQALDDKVASTSTELFPKLKQDGSLVKAGMRIDWHGTLKRAAVDLWDTEQNNPDNAPTLWEAIEYKDGYRIIPEVITITSQFAKGERGWWQDALYESLMDGNVYTPVQYPAGWAEVSDKGSEIDG